MELTKDAAWLECVVGHLTSAQHAFFRLFLSTKKKKKAAVRLNQYLTVLDTHRQLHQVRYERI